MSNMTNLKVAFFQLGEDDFCSIELKSHGLPCIDGSYQKTYSFLTNLVAYVIHMNQVLLETIHGKHIV